MSQHEAAAGRIEKLRLRRLQVPLAKPYKLAFGDVRHFDTILVELSIEDVHGLGEATILNGYTDETVEDSWALAIALADRLGGLSTASARSLLASQIAKAPFTSTAFLTAIDCAEQHPLLQVDKPTAVPLLFGINAIDPSGIEVEIEQALAAGFTTLKIKAGFSLEEDLARVQLIQRLNRGRALLRVDANQGFTREDGCAFARRLDPQSIELLEQPCAAADWEAAEDVARVTRVPLMLDESIYGVEDIDRAARIGASFVKLKLMKLGSLSALAAGLERIRALGMTAVLGNGVASDVGCWMEACVASRHIDNAGEMNGYRRQGKSLAITAVPIEGGAMQLMPGWRPQLDPARVSDTTVAEHSV